MEQEIILLQLKFCVSEYLSIDFAFCRDPLPVYMLRAKAMHKVHALPSNNSWICIDIQFVSNFYVTVIGVLGNVISKH